MTVERSLGEAVLELLRQPSDTAAKSVALAQIIASSREFLGRTGDWASMGDGAAQFHEQSIADAVLRVAEERGPTVAVERLSEFLSGTRFGRLVNLVAGVAINDRVELGPGVALVPLEQLESPRYDRNARIFSGMGDAFGLQGLFPHLASMAVTVDTSLAPAILRDGKAHPAFDEALQTANDATVLTVLAWPLSPVVLGSWWEPTNSFLLSEASFGWIMNPQDLVVGRPRQPNARGTERIREGWQLWHAASDSMRKRLRLALDRLGRAARRAATVDVAIELGVAIETLLVPERDMKEAIGLRLSLRAGWLLGTDPESRRTVQQLFSLLYTLRSTAVHQGELPAVLSDEGPSAYKERKTREVLDEGCLACCEVILKLLRDKPDFGRLVLGG